MRTFFMAALMFLGSNQAFGACTYSPGNCDSDPKTATPDCSVVQANAQRAYDACLAREAAARQAAEQAKAEAEAARKAQEAIDAAKQTGNPPSNGDDPKVNDDR